MTSPCRLTWLQHVGTGFQWRRESGGSLAVAVVSGGAATERVAPDVTHSHVQATHTHSHVTHSHVTPRV